MDTWILLRGLTREASHWGAFAGDFQTALPQAKVVALDLPGNGQLRFKNFIRIVLHPARLWENLGKFLLRHGADLPRLVK